MTTLRDLIELAGSGTGVCDDSRRVGKGDIFVAVGEPGSRHIPAALAAGAAYLVCEEKHAPRAPQIPAALVDDARDALGLLARAHYRTGRDKFDLIGITGTNGKTTIAYLLEHLFAARGRKPGVVGTVDYRWPGHKEKAPLTTPGCLRLHELIAAMAGGGADCAVMEVSSHALDQKRVAGLSFAAVALTNVTQDHLDYHGDMETYFAAKTRLFTGYPGPDKPAAVNADDQYGRRLLSLLPSAVGYGLTGAPGTVLSGRILDNSIKGLTLETSFAGETLTLTSPLIGAHNASNLLCAQAVAIGLGLPLSATAALSGSAGAPGRLERVDNAQNLDVFVDYAHTPDALENVLAALRPLTHGRLIAVFGCGGNRDKAKRPLMGKAVGEVADVAVLTSDNPRFEEPEAIIADVLPGLDACRNLIVEPDRKSAIALALSAMEPGDVTLIAGKGHEDYQEIKGVRSFFNDAAAVKELARCA